MFEETMKNVTVKFEKLAQKDGELNLKYTVGVKTDKFEENFTTVANVSFLHDFYNVDDVKELDDDEKWTGSFENREFLSNCPRVIVGAFDIYEKRIKPEHYACLSYLLAKDAYQRLDEYNAA
jgi:hypothetical protein